MKSFFIEIAYDDKNRNLKLYAYKVEEEDKNFSFAPYRFSGELFFKTQLQKLKDFWIRFRSMTGISSADEVSIMITADDNSKIDLKKFAKIAAADKFTAQKTLEGIYQKQLKAYLKDAVKIARQGSEIKSFDGENQRVYLYDAQLIQYLHLVNFTIEEKQAPVKNNPPAEKHDIHVDLPALPAESPSSAAENTKPLKSAPPQQKETLSDEDKNAYFLAFLKEKNKNHPK